MIGVMIALIITSFFIWVKETTIPLFTYTNDSWQELWGFEQKDISPYETLWYEWKLWELQDSDEVLALTLNSWVKYLSSLYDISKQYVFEWDWYRIQQRGIGDVYIDTQTQPGKIFVMSLNALVTVSLTNASGDEVYTDIHLSPHMYLEFQASRWSFLKNSDVLRVQTIYKLWYISTPLTEQEEDVILDKYLSGEDNFFTFAYTELMAQKKFFASQLKDFMTSSFIEMSGKEKIQRYMYMFVNDEKKKVFFQDTIFKSLILVVGARDYDAKFHKNLERDMKILQSLDEDAYQQMQDLFLDISALVYRSSLRDLINAKLMLWSVGSEELDKNYFLLYSYALFSDYDMHEKINPELEQKFYNSFHLYAQSQLQSKQRGYYEYFSYFLKEQLQSLIKSSQRDNVSSIIRTLEQYIGLSSFAYENNSTGKISRIYDYNDVLRQLQFFMRDRYFWESRDSAGLLELDRSRWFSATALKQFKSQVTTISTYISDNIGILDVENERDFVIKRDIAVIEKAIIEYFAALQNYESYTAQYDRTKQGILSIDVVWSQDQSKLSLEKARSYISQFIWISLADSQIQFVENSHYEFRNISISWRKMDFDIYPFSGNRMQNIFIDGKQISFVYNLDNKQEEWKELLATSNKNEKDLYDFSRFFLITFFTQQPWKVVEQFISNQSSQNEDKAEIVFKRDKLLNGEFKSIKDVMLLKYEDIFVERNGDWYDISLDDVRMEVPLASDEEGKSIVFTLDSEYIFTQNDHYFGRIKLSDFYEWSSSQIPLFASKDIDIIGKIEREDFRWEIQRFSENVSVYKAVYDSIVWKSLISNLRMQYAMRNKKMSFIFDYAGKKYSILVTGEGVEKMYRGTQNLISEPITPSQVINYIK